MTQAAAQTAISGRSRDGIAQRLAADLRDGYVPGKNPAVGGAMDLVAGAREVWVVMEQVDRAGQPKIVRRCTFPLTGREVVTRVYTDLAVFHIVDGELRLTEYAPGVTPAEVRERTGARYVKDLNPEG